MYKILPLAVLALSQAAIATAQTPPSAGAQLQQIPPAPVQAKPAPDIRIERAGPNTVPAADNVKIVVQRLRVSGARMYSQAQLLAVAGFKPGSELSLANLNGMAARIVERYRRDGYFVAQAYLPAQDIKDGAVTIAVVEGQYGKVTIHNHTNLSDAVVRTDLVGIRSGDVVSRGPLEDRLVLLSDVPGVTFKSTLVPGASIGATDLIVDVTPGRKVSGSVDADNAGNPYTGKYRLGATVNLNEPLGIGDVASLRVLSSGEGLNYARASYQLQVGRGQAGVAYSKLRYKLGEQFAPLHANGTANIASVYGSYPLVRSRDNNVHAMLAYDHKSFQDRVDATETVNDKKANVWMAGIYGDERDMIGGGGTSAYALTLHRGELDIETPTLRSFDALTARSNGSFGKWSYSASRVQTLTDTLSLSGAINGQFASKNLDVSEKMELGGMNAVRAYPEGEAYADQGYVITVEARQQLPKWSSKQVGQLTALAFVDSGMVVRDKEPWAGGENRRTLSGAGVGLVWADYNNFMVRAYYARKIGGGEAHSAPDRSGRFWIQAIKYF